MKGIGGGGSKSRSKSRSAKKRFRVCAVQKIQDSEPATTANTITTASREPEPTATTNANECSKRGVAILALRQSG